MAFIQQTSAWVNDPGSNRYATVISMHSHVRTAWVLHTKSLSHGTRCSDELEALRWFTSMKKQNRTVAISRNGKVRYSYIADPAVGSLSYEEPIGPLPRLKHYGVEILCA